MDRRSMYQVVASASRQSSPKLFERMGFQDLCTRVLDATGRWHQRNCPLKAPLVVWIVVMLSMHRSLSVPNVLKHVFNMLREREPELSLKAVTGEAVCHARKRLGVEPLKMLFAGIAEQINPRPSFHGLRTWGIDGVQATVPDTPANDSAFGRPTASRGTTAFPQMKIVSLVDTQTRQIKNAMFTRCDDAERPSGVSLMQQLGSGDLVLIDRGFAAVWVFEKCLDDEVHFVARISSQWKPRVVARLGQGDWLVKVVARVPLRPEERLNSRRKTRKVTLTLRLIEYRIGKRKTARLITSLTDPADFPARELALLYHERWECELAYDELKVHLSTVTHGTLHTVFRSKTPEGVKQEAYGLLVAYNLLRDLMAEAARAHGLPPLHISFVETLELVKLYLPRFQAAKPRSLHRITCQLLADIAATENDRPRRGRWFPRKVKVKMTNYHLKRATDREVAVDYTNHLQLAETFNPCAYTC